MASQLLKPILKRLIHMLNVQVSKALCMGINGFFTKNANQLMSVVSKKIDNINAEGGVTKEIIEKSKAKMDAAITKILDSENFKTTLAQKMADQLRILNIPVTCTSNGRRLGGGLYKKTRRNLSENIKKQTRKNIPKNDKES
jgi:hypothetical protein